MTPPNAATHFGFKSASMIMKSSNGNPIIFGGAAPANGDPDGIGGAELIGMGIALPFGEGEPVTEQAPGYLADFDEISFNNRADNNGILTASEFNMAQVAALQGQNVVTHGNKPGVGGGPANPQFPTLALLTHSIANSRDSATRGIRGFSGRIFMSAQLVPFGAATATGVAAQEQRMKYTFSPANVLPWGEVFDASIHGDCEYVEWKFHSDYVTDFDAYIGDGIETVFNIARAVPAPYTADNTGACTVAGVEIVFTTGYTIDTVAQTITFVVPPADGALVFFWHDILGGC